MTKTKELAPGVLLCLVLAVPCWLLGKAFPVVGGSVFAILIGMVIALFYRNKGAAQAGIAYTYNEPLVGWEYVRDCSQLAHDARLVNGLVSNGLAEPETLRPLAPLIDAANIDLKGFSPSFYEACGCPGALDRIKATIGLLAATPSCHLEVTTLVVPGMNDAEEEVDAAARWLAGLPYHTPEGDSTGDEELTYHVTRFFPRWHMADRAPTPVATVYALADVARRHLRHVRTGNC